MFARMGWIAVSTVLLAGTTAAATPYGPSGVLGPAGAPARTCDGKASCVVVSPSDAWETRIEGAAPGATILLRGGQYRPSGRLDVPAGTANGFITIANYNGESATIDGGLTVGSHVVIQGLAINRGSGGSYAIEIDRRTSTPKQNMTLRHLDVLGGTSEAIRIRGNIQGLLIADSLIDGGRDHHAIKVLCDNNSDVQPPTISCRWAPTVTMTHNRVTKNRAFPSASGEDLLQFEGAGDTVVTHNEFTGNPNGEECVDWKPQGGPGTSIVFSHNHLLGCNIGGILMHQSETNGSTVIEGNRIEDGGNLLRRVHAGTKVINNVFDGQLTVSASNLTIGHNTFTGSLKFGDTSQGAPNNLTIINNIFSGTRFSCSSVGCGNYSATRNAVFRTSGTFNCQNCITADPLLAGYEVKEGSSVQDKASPAFLVAVDIEGTKRPQGSAPDIGAFELVNGAAPTPPTASLTAAPAQIEEGQTSILTWNSTDADSCVGTGFQTGGAISGQATVSPSETSTYEVDCDGALDSATVTVTQAPPPDDPPPPAQQPFAANRVPGIVEGEDYDRGGEGMAYHDTTTGNKGGAYRADDVDIKANSLDPGHTIGWGATGEWLEWTIDVQMAGDYRISAYTGTNDATSPRFRLSIDDTPVGTVAVPNTGSWDVKQYVEVGVTALSAGRHLMRVDIDQGFVDLDHFEFAVATPTASALADTTAPVVEVFDPSDGARLTRRSDALVRIEASDDGAGVDTVTLRIEGQVVTTFSGAGEHRYSWRPMGTRNREAVIEAIAVDRAGNTDSHSVTARVTR